MYENKFQNERARGKWKEGKGGKGEETVGEERERYPQQLIRRNFMDMLSKKSNYREMMWLDIFTETTTTNILQEDEKNIEGCVCIHTLCC